MKVLHVNVVYNSGSTGKIVHDIHTVLLENGKDSTVCFGRGEKSTETNVYKVCNEYYAKANNLFSRLTGIQYGGCFLSTSSLISIIKSQNPDVVHLHCINGFFVDVYRLISWLKKNKIKTVLTLHAEFMYTANCSHAYECDKWKSGCGNCPRLKKATGSLLLDNTALSYRLMKKAFDGFDDNLVVTSVSPWLMNRAKQSSILKGKKHVVVLNGLDTSVFCYKTTPQISLPGDNNSKKVLFVTPDFDESRDHHKGGWYLIELAKRMPNVNFIVVCTRGRIKNCPKNVLFVGKIDNQYELAKYYSAVDVTLLASKRETFSMVLAESLCCGTPVVGFEAGGPESIALNDFCVFVEYGNIDALEKSLAQQLNKTYSCEEISDISSKIYDKKVMTNEYIKVYEKLVRESEK